MPTQNYPNILSTPTPQRSAYAPRFGLWLLLVLACLVLRGAMAVRVPSVDPDGVLYIELAKSLEAGDLAHGTQGMGLNTYPFVLMLVHKTGLDWEMAGVVWDILIASLVILPLYGWVRRQFDDRVAAAACLLYTIHPKFVEWSPELTRDPTFWFLLTLTLYLLWRAVTEVRLRWFVAAGPVLVLAILTRFEGLVLLSPLVLWTFWRWRALQTARPRLVVGAVLCMAIVPAIVLLGAVLWLRVPVESLSLRLDPWARFQTWIEYVTGNTAAAQVGLNPLLPADIAPMPLRAMLREFFATMTRGLAPIYALLMFGGLWGWRRTWARRDHQPLFYAAIGVLIGIWVHLWYDRMICPRYALTIVLLASPFAALGLLGLLRRLMRVAEWLGCALRTRQAVAGAAMVLILVVDVSSAMRSNRSYFASRRLAVNLGHWVRETPWKTPMIVGPAGMTPIMTFYAGKGRCQLFRHDTADAPAIEGLIQRYHPDLVLLQITKRMNAANCEELAARFKAQGFLEVDPVSRPVGSDPVVVLVRGQKAAPLVAHGKDASEKKAPAAEERLAARPRVAPGSQPSRQSPGEAAP